MADQRRLRSVVALRRTAPMRSPWRRSARGLPCDRSRRRLPRNPTILRCTLFSFGLLTVGAFATMIVTKGGHQRLNTSSRFAVAVHILTLLAYDDTHAVTSEFIADSVNTNPVDPARLGGAAGCEARVVADGCRRGLAVGPPSGRDHAARCLPRSRGGNPFPPPATLAEPLMPGRANDPTQPGRGVQGDRGGPGRAPGAHDGGAHVGGRARSRPLRAFSRSYS